MRSRGREVHVMFRTGRRAEMSADTTARNPRHDAIWSDRAPKSGEASSEDADEVLNEESDDALRIRVSSGHSPFPSPSEYRGVEAASTNVPRRLCEGVGAGMSGVGHANQGAEHRK